MALEQFPPRCTPDARSMCKWKIVILRLTGLSDSCTLARVPDKDMMMSCALPCTGQIGANHGRRIASGFFVDQAYGVRAKSVNPKGRTTRLPPRPEEIDSYKPHIIPIRFSTAFRPPISHIIVCLYCKTFQNVIPFLVVVVQEAFLC